MKQEEIKLLKHSLSGVPDVLDTLFDVWEFSLYFDDIADFRRFLIKYHDLLVNTYNKGSDTYNKIMRGNK